MSRGGARRRRRGGNRDTVEASHPDGWPVAGPGAPPRRQPMVGDLSQFGKISKTTPISFGPLAASHDGSGDNGAEETGALTSAGMSEAEVKAKVHAKIEEDIKEFFGVRMLDEAESYFSTLPTEHRYWLVDALVMKSITMKEPDVTLVGDLFVRVREKDLCSPEAFEDGFNRLAEALDDLVVDIPKAWPYFAILLRGSGLDQDEERRKRIAEKTMNPDKLNGLFVARSRFLLIIFWSVCPVSFSLSYCTTRYLFITSVSLLFCCIVGTLIVFHDC